MFHLIIFLVCALWALYISQSLIGKLGVASGRAWIIRALVLGAGCGFPLVLRQEMLSQAHPVLIPFFWYAKVGTGLLFILGSILLVMDMMGLPARVWGRIRRFQVRSQNRPTPMNPTRRRFMARTLAKGALGISATAAGYGVYQALKQPRVKTVPVPVKNLPPGLDGFSMALITDLHINTPEKREWLATLVRRVNALTPHAIALAGDLADGRPQGLGPTIASLAELSAPHGKFFVTGNHEYYSDLEGWLTRLRDLNFTLLMNEHRILSHNGSRILMGGVTDYSAGRMRLDHASRPDLAGATTTPSDYRILLAHQPKSIVQAAKAGFDLQLSGHTHGGQIIPFNFLTALDQPYLHGLHTHEKTQIYVSRGAGYWGPPVRWGAPSEISHIILTRA